MERLLQIGEGFLRAKGLLLSAWGIVDEGHGEALGPADWKACESELHSKDGCVSLP
jgi:hypothetical protein